MRNDRKTQGCRDPVTSRLPGFHGLRLGERLRRVARMFELSPSELRALRGGTGREPEVADRMIENAIGTFALPLGVGLNLVVNGRDYVVPMAVEEPSVIAALSLAGKIVRGAGGFTAEADAPSTIGQIQVTRYGDPVTATARIVAAKDRILALADGFLPGLVRRGGGAKDVEVRTLPAPEGPHGEPLLVVHLLVDTRDAMGANMINTVAEGVAPLIEDVTGGKVYLRILSNLAVGRLGRATCRLPVPSLADFGMSGDRIAEGILQAARLASADPYRAATHNKGIMNGIDAVAIATGQDWRAIEAGAHAFACRRGRYEPLSSWSVSDGYLTGRIELPLPVGTVGGASRHHPGVQLALKLLRVASARELAMVLASVGLAQNFAAIRALGSVGIQKGHMALHNRCVPASTPEGGQIRRMRRTSGRISR